MDSINNFTIGSGRAWHCLLLVKPHDAHANLPFDSGDLLVALGRDDGWEEKQEAVKVRTLHITSLLPNSGGNGEVRRKKKAPANLTTAGEIASKIDHAKLLLSVLTVGLALPS